MKLRAWPTALRSLAAASCLVLLGASCDERFEFDSLPIGAGAAGSPVGGAGGSPAGGGGAGAGLSGSTAEGGSLAAAGRGGSAGGGQGGSAVGCGVHAACPGAQRCIDGACFQCEADADCAATSYSHCHPERHRCVACVSPDDCPDDFTCDFRTNKCVHTCEDEIDCPAEVPGCAGGLCFKCDGDRDCEDSPLGAFCAADRSGCVQCRDADDCPDLCDRLMGRCVQCLDGLDCDSGICDLTTGGCMPG